MTCMKTITINVSEPVYEDFLRYSRELDRTASELIREAMENYRRERIHAQTDLLDFQPASVGKILVPWKGRTDLLEDFLDDRN